MHPVRESLPAAAEAVAELASGLVAQMEHERRLSPDVVKALTGAGFMRHFVPTAFGGNAGTFRDLMRAVATLGETCAATAWCASLFASSPRFVSFFPPEGRQEIWAGGPDATVVCSVIPFGEAVSEPGGLRVSGRWPYMSGIECADWVIVCAKELLARGGPRLTLVAVPRAQCRTEDTWRSVGMQATGSNTVVVEDTFVPAHRVGDRAALFAGRPADPAEPRTAGLAPLPAVNGLTFVVPALGAARGALALLTDHLGRKLHHVPVLPGVPGALDNQTTYETVLARSAAEIDASQLLLERIADLADSGEPITPEQVARNARDSAFAVDTLAGTVNRIFRTAGTSGQAADGPLQRIWRDVNAIATHQALQIEPTARAYARSLFTPRSTP
ncbi:acyl-CoA dehydrogenase family protein [Streptomyces platensis]|uniref:acyl-CoA dehydrogenase family protein n=1 Tax=Streptomyces platensis TaxID=58346 RepID=UPI002E81FBDF|nr:acyl-CoA dehydrogenase family protein [Streptomyces platensis]WUB82550.1 acyl-CoA dehydrogenase family protein [Streptomyces platensis]